MSDEFDTLPSQQQEPYLEWARHLIQKGYVSTSDERQLARDMYKQKVLDKPTK